MTPSDKMTVDEFLSWSEDKEGRWELHDGVPVRLHDPAKMQFECISHVRLKGKITFALGDAIEGNPSECKSFLGGLGIVMNDSTCYNPDALVCCGKALDDNTLTIPNPVIIVEVLSPSTAYKDVSTKLIDYFKLPSVMHYLVLDPAAKQITHHFCRDDTVRTKVIYEKSLMLEPLGLVALDALWA